MKRVELLAPAKNAEYGMAAVDAGADALYIGGPRLGARAGAANTADDVARLVEYARPFGVRVYAALNTLVFEHELREAGALAREMIDAGVDALIIQDTAYMEMGLAGVEFHASTQMCNTTAEHVKFLGHSGFSRVILERGLTLEQIRNIGHNTDVELECFIHGAVCVGLSGRCYLSRSMGPRSGNRGDCMQACRLTWDMEDERGNVLIKGKHLLSVRDMNLGGRLGDLLDAGVTSFKIEGRLKELSYVRNTVAAYRAELDREIALREGFVRASYGKSEPGFEPDAAKSFSRGAGVWMLDGQRSGHATPDSAKATGSHVGAVSGVTGQSFRLGAASDLAPGDGICFFSDGTLCGTRVNRVEGRDVFPDRMDGIGTGTVIFRNLDSRFERQITRARTRRTVAVRASLQLGAERITLSLTDEAGNTAGASIAGPFAEADNADRMLSTFRIQVEKSGDTIYDIRLDNVECDPARIPFVPIKSINELRRAAVEALTKAATQRRTPPVSRTADPSFPHPDGEAAGDLNVTNSLAARFYRSHGVRSFDPPRELAASFEGLTVMTSPWCPRGETGHCTRDGNTRPLFLRHGRHRYRIVTDCAMCTMHLVKE